jgi:hypothetical protein
MRITAELAAMPIVPEVGICEMTNPGFTVELRTHESKTGSA